MATIKEINQSNLKMLADKAGGISILANQLGVEPIRVSQWLTGYRGMGGASKRKFEEILELENGWFDTPQTKLEQDIEVTANTVRLELLYPERECQSHELDKLVMRFVMTKKIAIELLGTDELDHIKIYRPADDSMEPKIPKASMVLIDTNISDFSGDGVYIFNYEGKEYFRRLIEVKDALLKVTADSQEYKEGNFDISNPERINLKIIGKAWKVMPLIYSDI